MSCIMLIAWTLDMQPVPVPRTFPSARECQETARANVPFLRRSAKVRWFCDCRKERERGG